MRFHDTGYSGFLLSLIVFHGVVSAQSIVPRQVEIQPKFAHAIRSGYLNTIQTFLEAQPNQLEARDERGWTPLMLAAFYADVECVRLCLDYKAAVNATNDSGATALHYAATNLGKVQLLVAAGADVNAATGLGNTPLMLAARSSNSSSIVKLLLGNCADVHARNIFGLTALMIASSGDDVETVQLLLDRDADPNLMPYQTAFDKHGEGVDIFFGGGSNSPTWASIKGNGQIARLLLHADANVDDQSPFGLTLSAAAQNNRTDIARLLLQRGARVNQVPAGGGWTPLMWAAANEDGDNEMVKLLLVNGANVNAEEGEQWGPLMSMPHSPLMIARRRGQTRIVQILVNLTSVKLEIASVCTPDEDFKPTKAAVCLK